MTNMLSALNSYNNQMKLLSENSKALSDADATDNTFSKLVESQLDNVIESQKTAETAKLEAITGGGNITDLVTAIAEAELALNTIVTIRDRAISAYQDIIRMPI